MIVTVAIDTEPFALSFTKGGAMTHSVTKISAASTHGTMWGFDSIFIKEDCWTDGTVSTGGDVSGPV